MNDIGQAVGYTSTPTPFAEHAVLWQNDAAHTVIDLAVLPGDIASRANFINNAGQMVAIGLHDGQLQNILLTPIQ